MKQGKEVDCEIHDDGSLRFKGRWCVPQKSNELKRSRLMMSGIILHILCTLGVTSCIKILKNSIGGQI